MRINKSPKELVRKKRPGTESTSERVKKDDRFTRGKKVDGRQGRIKDFEANKTGRKFAGGELRFERKAPKFSEIAIEEKSDSNEDVLRLEGRNPVLEALKSGRTIEKLLIAKGAREGSIRQIIGLARDKHIIISEVDRSKLDTMSETGVHQGVIAIITPYKYVEVQDILDYAAAKGEVPFILILDEIHDPHNLGSMMRTANACGIHGIIISKRRAVGLTPTVAKASAGAIEYMKVAKVPNITQTIQYLKSKGLWIVGADMEGKKAYFEYKFEGPIAIVIGNEGEGIGRLVRENCDFIANIPMRGQIPSLNANVAGSIMMYEVLRQRILKG